MDDEIHKKRKTTQIYLTPHFRENDSLLPFQKNSSLSQQKSHRRRTSSVKNFNCIDKDNNDKELAHKIFESLKLLDIFKVKLSEMMKKYEKIFSTVFDLHVGNIRKHIVKQIII